MAGGGNFLHRVISYVANELIVNGLANRSMTNETLEELEVMRTGVEPKPKLSHRVTRKLLNSSRKVGMAGQVMKLDFWVPHLYSHGFQRFAVRTSRRLEDLSKMAEQTKRQIADQIKDASKNFESFKNQ